MRVAAVLMDILRNSGVRYLFGNPGTTELPIMQALPDYPDLRFILGLQESVVVAMADGFAGLKAKLPPPTRRGVVLIDPPYEVERDYARVVATLREALERFADGTYVVWYPQVSRVEAAQLPKRLQAVAPKGWLHARLTVQAPDHEGFGLMGSGMFVINPPYTLHGALSALLPWLHAQLAQYEGGGWLLDQKAV